MADFKKVLDSQTVRFILFILLLVGLVGVGRSLEMDVERLKVQLLQYPLWLSGIVYILFYVGLTLLIWLGPKDVFRISGALLYGPYISTVFVTIAELISLVFLFYMSRKLGRGFVEERMKVKSGDIEKTKKEVGWFNVFTLRINPLVPYRFLDLAYGLTKISFKKYFLVALFSSPPRIFWLQYILAGVGTLALKDLAAMIEYFQSKPEVFLGSCVYMLFVIVVSVIAVVRNVVLARKARRSA
ncbi:MAG: VTT domain-containing protein [Candidatus Omnitrophota bacterium]|nr:VTT domain-containing protein [Candidatus Omnitrophota bacterium]MDZ4243275.1 VTT domain-containing protein [Candidatus Omnitrophota bacterium]